MASELSTRQERQQEVLRAASVALGDRLVVLWEASPHGEVLPMLTSMPVPHDVDLAVDLDAALGRRGAAIIQGSRWVGCRVDGTGPWCVAPVRSQPAAPPPYWEERRGRERMTLELAGLCLGLLERAPEAARPRLPEPEALKELARHPSMIAHEVANPLTAALVDLDNCSAVVQTAETLERTLRAGVLRELSNVERRIGQALEFLQSLQDQARGALARFERFNAVAVVQSCIVLMRPLARKQGVGLKWETSLDAVFLQGDPNALYRLTSNVIRNALEASEPQSDFVTVTLEQVGEGLQLAVRDRGAGIPPEHLDRIFEPGFTTREFGSGGGLGLTLVRELVEKMFGGTVTAKSTLGAGTLVTVVLPVPPQRRPRPVPRP